MIALKAFLRALTPRAWAAIALLLAFLIFGAWCQHRGANAVRGEARKAEAGQAFAEGRTGAAVDASAIRDQADVRTARTDTITKETTDAIRQAPDRAAAERAALRGLCRHDPGADARCAVLIPGAGGVG